MKVFSKTAAFLALACPALAALAATPAPAAAPRLKVDPSPVSAGRPGVVTSYADVLEPVQRAVVSIHSTKIVRIVNPVLRQFFGDVPGVEQEGKQRGLGSGVIVTPDGYILTNNHVVEGADELTVTLPDDRNFAAKVVGADAKTDLAVVKIEASGLPVLTLADSDRVRVGDIVFAVGNPLEVGETVTMGIVSAKGRNLRLLNDVQGYEDFIQTDAAINLGNSGGALVDAKGRLVGINSAIISPSRGNIGLGFAIPVNLAASVMRSLVANGTVRRGYLGVDDAQALTPDLAEQLGLSPSTRGVVIADVRPGSPADRAGLRSSDVVLSINGREVSAPETLRLQIAEMPPGARISLKVVSGGQARTVDIVLSSLDDKPTEILSGVTAEPLSEDLRRQLDIDPRVTGLRVSAVAQDSPYADAIAANMVIVSIDQAAAADVGAAKEALKRPGRHLLLVYYRGVLTYLTVTAGR
jgi:serine protease Do